MGSTTFNKKNVYDRCSILYQKVADGRYRDMEKDATDYPGPFN